MTAKEMQLSMQRTRVENKWFEYIPTHYIIWCSGDTIKVNDRSNIVWATLNTEANQKWIHIEVIGDFNKNTPSDIQYESLIKLLWSINKRARKVLPINTHSDFQSKNCPWKKFDMNRIINSNIKDIDSILQILSNYKN
jgi:hypothetical protein